MSRVQRWEQRSEIPLLFLAVAFLVAYAWPILNPRLDRSLSSFLDIVSWAVWAVFLVDFLIRLGLAEHRLAYARKHWYDVLVLALPMLRPLRLLRVLAFARLLSRTVTRSLAGRASIYMAGTAVAAVGLGALAVLDAEQEAQDANLTSIGDALWWATTTVTTVGYGDFYPVTLAGRLVAVALMLVGIGLIGSVTAAVAAWFVSSVQKPPEPDGVVGAAGLETSLASPGRPMGPQGEGQQDEPTQHPADHGDR